MREKLNSIIFVSFKEKNNQLKETNMDAHSMDYTISKVFDENCGRIYKIKLPEGVRPGQLVEAELRDGQKFIYQVKKQDIENKFVILSEN